MACLALGSAHRSRARRLSSLRSTHGLVCQRNAILDQGRQLRDLLLQPGHLRAVVLLLVAALRLLPIALQRSPRRAVDLEVHELAANSRRLDRPELRLTEPSVLALGLLPQLLHAVDVR